MKDNKNEFDKLTACTNFLEFESQWRLLKRRKVRNRNKLKMEGQQETMTIFDVISGAVTYQQYIVFAL